jgi:hypothetical protein
MALRVDEKNAIPQKKISPEITQCGALATTHDGLAMSCIHRRGITSPTRTPVAWKHDKSNPHDPEKRPGVLPQAGLLRRCGSTMANLRPQCPFLLCFLGWGVHRWSVKAGVAAIYVYSEDPRWPRKSESHAKVIARIHLHLARSSNLHGFCSHVTMKGQIDDKLVLMRTSSTITRWQRRN